MADLPKPGSVWRKGDEWRIVLTAVSYTTSLDGGKVLNYTEAWRQTWPDSIDEISDWRAWAADAECVQEGKP